MKAQDNASVRADGLRPELVLEPPHFPRHVLHCDRGATRRDQRLVLLGVLHAIALEPLAVRPTDPDPPLEYEKTPRLPGVRLGFFEASSLGRPLEAGAVGAGDLDLADSLEEVNSPLDPAQAI